MEERTSGEGQGGGEKARKGAQRYLYCEGTGRRQMHAVPAHVADQVHLGESYKFTVINPGRGRETVVLACMAALHSQMVVLRSSRSPVLPFSLLPARACLEAAARPPLLPYGHQLRFISISFLFPPILYLSPLLSPHSAPRDGSLLMPAPPARARRH